MNIIKKMFPKETCLISNQSFIFNIVLFVVYTVISFIVFAVVNEGLHLFLVWNLLLAAIPYAISVFLERGMIKSKVMIGISLVFWLLFFPNSIYIITDLIYGNSRDFMVENGYGSLLYTQNLEAYLKLFHIYLGSVIGLMYGYKSLSVIYDLAKDTFLKKYRDLITILVFMLSGIGIYIGRFFRYNSWELIKIFAIIKDFFVSFNGFTIFFVLSLALLQAIVFYGFKINFIEKNPN